MANNVFFKNSTILRFCGVTAMVAGLTACAGLPSEPRQPVRYDLGVASLVKPSFSAAAPAVAAPPLVLADVQASGLPQGETAMLYRLDYADGQQLQTYQETRWSLPPAQLLQQRLSIRLGMERPVLSEKDNVRAMGANTRSVAMLRLNVDEFSQIFESPASSKALVRVNASLIGPAEGARNQLLGQKVFSVEIPASTQDAAGGVKAMARAVDVIGDQLNAWLEGYGR